MQAILHAFEVSTYGGPQVLKPVERTIPQPNAGEVLIRIRASAVSRADGMMRAGKPKFARPFLGWSKPRSGLSGTCFAGDVIALGEGVTRFQIGDRVFGEAGLKFGANASHITLAANGSLLKKPDTLSYEEAAVMFDGAMTSWHFLTRVANLQKGERILILGGSGSLGSAAIQFAHALGAHVTATSSAKNAELLMELGADEAVDYRAENPLNTRTAYDVVFDTLGVSRFGQARPALKSGGRYVCPVLGFGLLKDMILTMKGTKRALFAAAGMSKPEVHQQELSEILELVAAEQFRPLMDRTYPLSDLVEAHSYMETGHKRGNVVVV